ncbi:hypothetical protein PUN28_005773 [Cardiocondyla obscurior]|uniref:Uncharacterized protein n=1 Tax=Cardiocondyla obscurior TaxID=286306 RepID=A0AAW2GBM4_9HYME
MRARCTGRNCKTALGVARAMRRIIRMENEIFFTAHPKCTNFLDAIGSRKRLRCLAMALRKLRLLYKARRRRRATISPNVTSTTAVPSASREERCSASYVIRNRAITRVVIIVCMRSYLECARVLAVSIFLRR